MTQTIPIRYGRLAPLFSVLGWPRSSARIVVDDHTVTVRMSYAFQATFPRSAVQRVRRGGNRYFAIGVHGWRGKWLVNGAADGIVWIDIAPSAPAKVLGKGVALRCLGVSVDDPDSLCALLAPSGVPPENATPHTT